MKILMLNANLAGCGTYFRALWFARLAAQNGRHQVTLATVSRNNLWHRNNSKFHGINISEGPKWGYHFVPGYGSNWLDIAWRWNQIRLHKYDLIYAFEYHPNVRWPLTALSKNQILLSDWCDWYAGAANKFRNLKLAHKWDKNNEEHIRFKAARVSVISSQLLQRSLDIGLPKNKLHLIREGVDTNFMHPFDKAQARRTLSIDNSLNIVGTLQDGAAFPHLVKAFIKVKLAVPNSQLLFVGQPSLAQLNLIDSFNLAQDFIFTGRCTDQELPLFLSAADVLALPMEDSLANQARFPHKIGDYLACGRPVVVTNIGDYPSMLRADNAALVANSYDIFAEEIINLLNSPDKQQFYAQAGRDWVCQNLDWNIIKPSLLKFIEGGST